MIIVTLEDARATVSGAKQQFCKKGIRAFFKKYNLDYHKFCKEGIDAEELIATNDSMAMQVVEVARGRQQ